MGRDDIRTIHVHMYVRLCESCQKGSHAHRQHSSLISYLSSISLPIKQEQPFQQTNASHRGSMCKLLLALLSSKYPEQILLTCLEYQAYKHYAIVIWEQTISTTLLELAFQLLRHQKLPPKFKSILSWCDCQLQCSQQGGTCLSSPGKSWHRLGHDMHVDW
jgi:hypothetical protein